MAYRIEMAETEEEKAREQSFTGIGLTSRKNLCIHPEVRVQWLVVRNLTYSEQVAKEKKGKVVDARCRDITNSAACKKGREDPGSVDLCDWHEVRCTRTSGIVS